MADFFDGLDEAMRHLSGPGAFLTAKGADGTINTMTIGWGYIGYSWVKPYFVAMVRKSRYTHEVIGSADSFTVSIPYGKEMKRALALCGTHSGRDVNKEEVAGISYSPARSVSSPIVDGCDRYYECAMTYVDTIHLDKLPEEIVAQWYADGDYHDLYYGEIIETYASEG